MHISFHLLATSLSNITGQLSAPPEKSLGCEYDPHLGLGEPLRLRICFLSLVSASKKSRSVVGGNLKDVFNGDNPGVIGCLPLIRAEIVTINCVCQLLCRWLV